MKKLRPTSCAALNAVIEQKLMAFFKVFRENYPKQMVSHFGDSGENVEDQKDDIGDALSDEQMNEVFDRNDYVNEDPCPKLKLLWELAKNLAEETYTEADASLEQLEKNLVSVIGQKSVEMNLLALSLDGSW